MADAGHSGCEGGRDGFPVHGEIRDFHPTPGLCDIVSGGFPCQPFSQAGKRLSEADSRNMWPHALRVPVESDAPLGFFENVPGLLSSGYFGTVLGDLAEAGFNAEWCVLGADDVGAPHQRKRVWILAVRHGYDAGKHARAVAAAAQESGRDAAVDLLAGRGKVSSRGAEKLPDANVLDGRSRLRESEPQAERRGRFGDGCSPWWCDPADVAHPSGVGQPGQGPHGDASHPAPAGEGQGNHALDAGEPGWDEWLLEPYVGRVAHGMASRVDRLRALGNGQVPHTMAAAWCLLATAAGILEE